MPVTSRVSADYTVAVRSLCEFTARRGDLSVRFTPAPTAQQGIAGHAAVAARRGPDYQREVTLTARHGTLLVRGRADGYDPAGNRLEEFKTHRGELARLPANQRNLHWAQLKIYGWMLCRQRSLSALELALVYFDIRTERETVLLERCSAVDLRTHFEEHCAAFSAWALQERAHRECRDGFLVRLRFPHAGLRRGQRQMAEEVYRAARDGQCLTVEAPTGIGKTVASVFPMLKAAPARRLDKVFFLVAKTSGRRLALDALAGLGLPQAPAALRVLELVAKDDACRFPGRACEAESCPLAAGFYDRLPRARTAALEHAVLDQQTLGEVAASAEVCPYYLAQEMARWSDVVVGDYNYFLDLSAILHGLTVANQWRVGLLVDEAHNLVARGRDMYSATLAPEVLDAALPVAHGRQRIPLEQLSLAWQLVHQGRPEDYFCEPAIAPGLMLPLQQLIAAVGDDIAEGALPDARMMRLYFDALHFCRMVESFGAHSLFDVTRTLRGAALCIRNVSPAPFLAPRFAACDSTVLFSATLSPADYYRRLLGLPAATRRIAVESPFGADQLDVCVERRISTRWRDRAQSVGPIARLLARQYADKPGNYLAFFSSFDYLGAVHGEFAGRHPHIATWMQSRAMQPADRAAFLARFVPSGRGIGFAVLGGVFAEGIDLPGDRLIGAFIATLGLPCFDGVNAAIEARLQLLFDAGYEYTYLYPGLQKVVQAAGRVIRTEADRGTLHLIDDRYTAARVRRLLPAWWRIRCS